jgi:hypothetical protein
VIARPLTIAVALAGVALVGCGSDAAAPATTTGTTSTIAATSTVATTVLPSTTAAPTTAPATSAAATTTAATTTAAPPTTAAPVAGFNPRCVDHIWSNTPPAPLDEAALDRFGPLGTHPALQIQLPLGRATATDDPQPTTVSPMRIPGGVLLSVSASSFATFDGGVLAAIDADGTRRWVDCLPQGVYVAAVAPASTAPTEALVTPFGAVESDAGVPHFVSLQDGTTTRTLAAVLTASGIPAPESGYSSVQTSGGGVVVLGANDDSPVALATSRLVVLDLTTMRASLLAYPPSTKGKRTFEVQLQVADDGRILDVGPTSESSQTQAVLAVEQGGVWSTKASDRRTARSTQVQFIGPALSGVDALGAVRWTRSDLASVPHEGFQAAADGDVALAVGCAPGTDLTLPCDLNEPYLVGVDARTGATRWQLAGVYTVSELGNGLALISDELTGASPGWSLIDTATGKPAASDQHWSDPTAFENACCGDGETRYTLRDGGMIIGVHDDRLQVWFPEALTPATTAIVALL